MHIGIATWQKVLNHGAVLQAVASKRILEDMGHSVSFVQYESQANGYKPPKRMFSHLMPWNVITRKKYTNKKKRLFSLFLAQHLPEQSIATGQWDIVMIGSDEVFSQEGGFNPALLGIGYRCPVFSYAASCGSTTKTHLLQLPQKEQMAVGLKSMRAIGVRDENTFEIVETLTGQKPVMNIDPVLLYGFEREIKSKVPPNRKNIGLYAYPFRWDCVAEIKMVKKLARKMNTKIAALGFHHSWCPENKNVGPLDILQQFSSCQFILTDTFHGTILSIITHTPFGVIVRNESPKLLHLLHMFGLENRIITAERPIDIIAEDPIDFEKIEALLSVYRKESLEYLCDVLLAQGG